LVVDCLWWISPWGSQTLAPIAHIAQLSVSIDTDSR
jgi:hypothetical protein